ncbi:MAG: FG-GAP repeat domain-containing protein [Pyrinomonadaceae bacterium]
MRSSYGVITYTPFGNFTTDYLVPGDFDGDGKTDLSVARTGAVASSQMVWWIKQSSDPSVITRPFGISSDLPVQGDYDGDARTDIAVYSRGATASSNSTFWVIRSFDQTTSATLWGLQADFPVATFDAR